MAVLLIWMRYDYDCSAGIGVGIGLNHNMEISIVYDEWKNVYISFRVSK